MMFNITSIIGLIVSLIITMILCKPKDNDKWLKIITLVLLVIKITEYVYMNIKQGFTYPIEISAITYYMFSIIVLFNIKKLYHIAAFFGIISGLGFFIYYSTLGYIEAFYYEMGRHAIAVMAHGILLIGGIYLLKKYDFRETHRSDILLTMILILAHGSIFYDEAVTGKTFIYFLIRPEFLEVFQIDFYNHVLMLVFYFVSFSIFIIMINKFYSVNINLRLKDKIFSKNRYNESSI